MKQPNKTVDGALPAGTIVSYSGNNIPEGFLDCTGASLSRTVYKKLFAAIGVVWGVGDGSTTFNIPDGRGKGVIGVGTGAGLTNRTLGTTYGAETYDHNHQWMKYQANHSATYDRNLTYNSSGTEISIPTVTANGLTAGNSLWLFGVSNGSNPVAGYLNYMNTGVASFGGVLAVNSSYTDNTSIPTIQPVVGTRLIIKY